MAAVRHGLDAANRVHGLVLASRRVAQMVKHCS